MAIQKFIEDHKRVIVCAFFGVYFLLGVWIAKDYGISWDEPFQRNTGYVTYNYLVEGDSTLLNYRDRCYGVAAEVPLIFLEKLLRLKDARYIYLARHYATFFLFYLCVFFFYLLCKYHFKSWKIGLLGSLFLILTPRVFAHSFYNTKDLTFLSMFVIAGYYMIKSMNEKTLLCAGISALTSALLIDMRIVGILVPGITLCVLLIEFIKERRNKRELLKVVARGGLYVVALAFFTVLFWPFLWEAPVINFIEAIKRMSRYVAWDGTMLYMSEYVRATQLPWHYAPVWISITTPIMYLFCFFAGVITLLITALRNPVRFAYEKQKEIAYLMWFFAPLLMAILLKSVLYDAWRHLYFIYPGMLMIALIGLVSIFKTAKRAPKAIYYALSLIMIIVMSVNVYDVVAFMVKNHPHQDVYFNKFAGRNMKEVKNNYELDYWGVSYREALEYILANDKRDTIKILAANDPCNYNAMILPPEERKRLVFVKDPQQADYFLTNYRWHKDEYPETDLESVYSIKVGNAKIMGIYKIRKQVLQPTAGPHEQQ